MLRARIPFNPPDPAGQYVVPPPGRRALFWCTLLYKDTAPLVRRYDLKIRTISVRNSGFVVHTDSRPLKQNEENHGRYLYTTLYPVCFCSTKPKKPDSPRMGRESSQIHHRHHPKQITQNDRHQRHARSSPHVHWLPAGGSYVRTH